MMPPALNVLPLLITAGFVALVLLWPRVRSRPSGARLLTEMIVTTFAFTALAYGLLMAAQRPPW
ncbi:MAG: hypothetical protein QM692_08130 [Thermomicrobiales bacterium]